MPLTDVYGHCAFFVGQVQSRRSAAFPCWLYVGVELCTYRLSHETTPHRTTSHHAHAHSHSHPYARVTVYAEIDDTAFFGNSLESDWDPHSSPECSDDEVKCDVGLPQVKAPFADQMAQLARARALGCFDMSSSDDEDTAIVPYPMSCLENSGSEGACAYVGDIGVAGDNGNEARMRVRPRDIYTPPTVDLTRSSTVESDVLHAPDMCTRLRDGHKSPVVVDLTRSSTVESIPSPAPMPCASIAAATAFVVEKGFVAPSELATAASPGIVAASAASPGMSAASPPAFECEDNVPGHLACADSPTLLGLDWDDVAALIFDGPAPPTPPPPTTMQQWDELPLITGEPSEDVFMDELFTATGPSDELCIEPLFAALDPALSLDQPLSLDDVFPSRSYA